MWGYYRGLCRGCIVLGDNTEVVIELYREYIACFLLSLSPLHSSSTAGDRSP